MGSQSQSHHSHIKHLASLNSSLNCPCMLLSIFFFLRFNTYPLFNFLSLFGLQENKREKNIGYCSLCCLSFILLYKGWNFWFVFNWEGQRNYGFCDLLKVEPNGCLRLRLKSLISFIVIWLLRKFERIWECEKKNLGLMIYVT